MIRMRLFPVLVGVALATSSVSVYPQQGPDPAAAGSRQTLVTRYCVTCHNDRAKTGGLSLEAMSVAAVAEGRPDPGRTEALHRLNRAEYRNAVRDLLSVDIDVSAMLPADDVSYGFDNIAGVQRMSPTLMERYLAGEELDTGARRC